VYHVMSRGHQREDICLEDLDRSSAYLPCGGTA
jgi:hypothetical protein